MLVHHDPLFLRQQAGLVDDLVGDSDLADVVKDPTLSQSLAGLLVEARQPAGFDRQRADALGVTLGVRVLRLDRIGEGEDHLRAVLEPIGGEPRPQRCPQPGVELGRRRREVEDVVGAGIQRIDERVLARVGAGNDRQKPSRCGTFDATADGDAGRRSGAHVDAGEVRLGSEQSVGGGVDRVDFDDTVLAGERGVHRRAEFEIPGQQD